MTSESARRLLGAVAALILAGLAQELCLLLGVPRLGVVVVAPALVAVVWLWRPRGAALGLLGLALGIQLLLPLHTGGARFSDWALHYEVSLRFGGQPTFALASALPGRTALFHQLNGAFLANWAAFPAFQLVATLLNSLWLWPAAHLVGRGVDHNQRRVELALLGLGLGPTLLAYTVYPWPWAFAAFFLLSALWLAELPGRLPALGMGLALGGALLAHPGSLGYVIGLGVFIVARRRAAVPAVAIGAALAGLTAFPWLLDVTGGHLDHLLGASIVARQNAGPVAWPSPAPFSGPPASFRAPCSGAPPLPEFIVQVFVLSLPGALLAAWVWSPRAAPSRRGSTGDGGYRGRVQLAGLAPERLGDGHARRLYLGIVVVLVAAVSRATPARTVRLAQVNAIALVVFVAALLWVSFVPANGDPNLALKTHLGIRLFADHHGLVPGGLIPAGVRGRARLRIATQARVRGLSPCRRESAEGCWRSFCSCPWLPASAARWACGGTRSVFRIRTRPSRFPRSPGRSSQGS